MNIKLVLSILAASLLFNLVISSPLIEPYLKIGSFNIQTLGPTKMSRPEFVNIVKQVIAKYDIMMIQEIRDSSIDLQVIKGLLKEVNLFANEKGINYSYIISPRLGQGTYKEQLAYFYRTNTQNSIRKIQVIKDMIHQDFEGVYDRPPYIAEFYIKDTTLSINQFTLMNVHLRPNYVFTETMGLRTVVDRYLNISYNVPKHIAILGDFNIDCGYISITDRNTARAKLQDFTWYIRDRYATTISTSNCAYDRILINTDSFKNAVKLNSNQTYRYDLEFGLNSTETSKISDHYPIELQIF